MADALAIIGVIGVAGQIIQLIARHGLDWKDAPAETAKCLEDINLLKAMLEDTDTDALATLSTEWRAATAASMSACKEELARLYRELTRRTVGHRVGWKRLKGAFGAKKTREAVEDLHRRFQAINDSVSRDALAVVTKGVTELREAQQQTVLDKDTEQILDWISSADYDSIHSDFIGRRQEGTGKWLLESEEYKQWLDGSKKALFCPGIPGAGKTMATAIVVDDLLERFRGNHNVGIAFIYCNFRRQGDQKPEHLLASFLKQLCQRRASLPKGVRDLFDECESRKRRPRLDELAAALKDIIPKFSRAFLIIDALDECGMEGGSRSKLLAEYTSLRDLVGANIFATSRHIDDIKQKFVGSPSLEILAQPEDIRRYLADKIPHLASFVADNAQLQEEIKTAIVNAVEGMFLLAKLHLDSLQGQRSPKQIRLISNKFRKGSDAYYYAYEDAMVRIGSQPQGLKDLAMQALAWIVCAKRPLKSLELREALAIELDSDEVDPDNRSRIEDVVSACAGLVTVDEQDQVVRLVHYTVQEYFGRTMEKWFPTAEKDIAQACVAYLSSSVFDSQRFLTGPKNPVEDFRDWWHKTPQHYLFEYALVNWGHHARLSTKQESEDQMVMRSVMRFLESTQHVITSFVGLFEMQKDALSGDVYNDSQWLKNNEDDVLSSTHGIHLSAIFGLDWALSQFLQQVHPNIYDHLHHTPLSWAIEFGWPACMALLLEAGADLKQQIGLGENTVLWLAAAKGDETMVNRLLHLVEENDVSEAEIGHVVGEPYDLPGTFTPLGIAAAYGHMPVVRLFLEDKRARLECIQLPRNFEGEIDEYGVKISPLYAAAAGGYTSIVETLIDHGALMEGGNYTYATPIVVAVDRGNIDVVRLLLSRQVDPNTKDLWGRTLLAIASRWGMTNIVHVLLEAGADPNASCNLFLTVLYNAVLGRERIVVNLLLENERFQTRLDRKDDCGGSAVFWAAVRGEGAIVDTLVAHGAQGRPTAGWDLTPLHKAALNLPRGLVEELLSDLAIDIMLWDASGRAPQANPESLEKYFARFADWRRSAFMNGSWDVKKGKRIVGGYAMDLDSGSESGSESHPESASPSESEVSNNDLAQDVI